MITPLNLDVALAVEKELQSRIQEADALRQQQVDRAQYEVELARRRYLRVDPDNRLVADSLEADWNDKLRALQSAQEEYERQRQADRHFLDDRRKQEIRALADDFPRIWNNPNTSHREKKRLVRLLIEDVTLTKKKEVIVQIRFKGGATKSLTLPLPKKVWLQRQPSKEVVEEVDRLLDQYTDSQVAEKLNAQGIQPMQSGNGPKFNTGTIARLRKNYGLKSYRDRLRETGLLTKQEIAQELGISEQMVKIWQRNGRLKGHIYNDRKACLYEPVGSNPPAIRQRLQKTNSTPFTSDRAHEV